jgi:hypothetical protein
MSDGTPTRVSPVAKKVMNAIIEKMQAHANDLDEGKTGNIRWRKDKGEVNVELTTTK